MHNDDEVEYTCTNCGAVVDENDKYCAKCGADVSEIQEGVDEEDIDNSVKKDLYGVRGWLLFFCFGLVILSPLSGLYNCFTLWNILPYYQLYYPNLASIFLGVIFVTVAIIIFSIIAGISLWRIKPNAVQLTKYFLILYIINEFINYILLSTADGPGQLSSFMGTQGTLYLLRSTAYFIGWYFYLKKSKRVKNTYLLAGNTISINEETKF